MSIAHMSLIEIIAPRAERSRLVSLMQDFGFLQLEEVPLVIPGVRSFLHREQLTEEQEHDQEHFRTTLKMIDELKDSWRDSSPPNPQLRMIAKDGLKNEEANYLYLQTSRMKRKFDSLSRKHSNILHDITSLKRYQERIDQLAERMEESPLAKSLIHTALLVNHGDYDKLDALASQLASITKDGSQVLCNKASGHGDMQSIDVALLVFPEEYSEGVTQAVRRSQLPELRLPRSVQDMPLADALKVLQQRLAELPEKLATLDKEIVSFSLENRDKLDVIEAICADTLARLESLSTIAHSDMLTVVHAWIPGEKLDDFRSFIRESMDLSITIHELSQLPGQAGNVPVRLENRLAIKPFERVLQVFSMPLYGSFDPTLIMAVIFPLFFGLILGDVAYGLIFLGMSFWARHHWRHHAIIKDVSLIAIWCAAASTIFGVIFGEIFGDLGERLGIIPLMIGGVRVMPIWKSREHAIGELLYITIAIGFLHVVLGLILGIVESVRMHNRRHIWERVGMLLGLLGISTLVLSALVPGFETLIPPAVTKMTITSFLIVSTFLLFKFSGVAGPIEIISLVANVLSYCRLMALGVAGMVLANLANSLGSSQQSIILGILVAIPIHALALALGIVEPAIHALRLHFVEFLPKFYVGDGRDYSPLKRKDLIDE